MAQEHYFSAQPAGEFTPRTLTVPLDGHSVEVVTAGGVFSPSSIDTGTSVLLSAAPAPPPGGDLLDLGCGWGPIALTLALKSPHARVWAVDVNERARDLTRMNAERLDLDNVTVAAPDEVPAGIRFTTIWSNPPIRIGKGELHGLLDDWLPRLDAGSDGWLVVARNLGADSLQRWMEGRYAGALQVTRAATSKGFRVLRTRKRAAATALIGLPRD
jgi:16S rRNA (guanine1207-N2)-methyltransferase